MIGTPQLRRKDSAPGLDGWCPHELKSSGSNVQSLLPNQLPNPHAYPWIFFRSPDGKYKFPSKSLPCRLKVPKNHWNRPSSLKNFPIYQPVGQKLHRHIPILTPLSNFNGRMEFQDERLPLQFARATRDVLLITSSLGYQD